jgi:hypothetical protein
MMGTQLFTYLSLDVLCDVLVQVSPDATHDKSLHSPSQCCTCPWLLVLLGVSVSLPRRC